LLHFLSIHLVIPDFYRFVIWWSSVVESRNWQWNFNGPPQIISVLPVVRVSLWKV
jgi:hypothetical protein